MSIRAMTDADADAVLAIYRAGIDTGDATFEVKAPDWQGFCAGKLPDQRLVAVDPGTGGVLGWAALSAVSDRCAYAGVAENAIYVDPAAPGAGGWARRCCARWSSRPSGQHLDHPDWSFPENGASLAVHAKVGFRVVGRRERIGQHHGVWRDVMFLERRSPVIG